MPKEKHKYENRNRRLVRQLLKGILRDARNSLPPKAGKVNRRLLLKGDIATVTSAVKKAGEYLLALKTTPQRTDRMPPAIWSTVAECRRVASSSDMLCAARMEAIEKLLAIECVTVPQSDDATWEFIRRETGLPPAVPAESRDKRAVAQRVRNRDQAVLDIKAALAEDIEAGRVTTLSQVVEQLRLPETPPTEVQVKPGITNTDQKKIAAALEAFRKAN